MTYRSLLSLALLALLPSAAGGQARETGLLLGLRYHEAIPAVPPYYAGRADSLSRDAYYTLLLVKQDGRIAREGEYDGLLVPRPDGLWEVDVKRSVYNDWIEDFLWSGPLGRPPRLPGIQAFNGEYCAGYRAQSVLAVTERYLSLEQRTAGYCEGAAHPWMSHALAVVPIDSTTHLGLTITDVLGPRARTALQQAAADLIDDRGADAGEDEDFFLPEPDEANWGFFRRDGRWIVRGRLDAAYESANPPYLDFDVAADPPPSLGGRAPLVPSWSRIKAFSPDALDAVVSPAQDLLVILHPSRLTVHPLVEGTIGAAAVTIRLRPDARLVLSRWGTGPVVRRWRDRLASPPRP